MHYVIREQLGGYESGIQAGDVRITEAGDTRTTEAGDTRVIEEK